MQIIRNGQGVRLNELPVICNYSQSLGLTLWGTFHLSVCFFNFARLYYIYITLPQLFWGGPLLSLFDLRSLILILCTHVFKFSKEDGEIHIQCRYQGFLWSLL